MQENKRLLCCTYCGHTEWRRYSSNLCKRCGFDSDVLLTTEDDRLRENAILLAKHHRKHCEGAECNISLYLLQKLLEKAGITLTNEEKKEFL